MLLPETLLYIPSPSSWDLFFVGFDRENQRGNVNEDMTVIGVDVPSKCSPKLSEEMGWGLTNLLLGCGRFSTFPSPTFDIEGFSLLPKPKEKMKDSCLDSSIYSMESGITAYLKR